MDVGRLRNIPVFADMSDADLQRIATFATEDSAPEGAVLVREGDYSTELIAIEEGTAEVRHDGRQLATLGPGDVFGETGVLDKEPAQRLGGRDVAAADRQAHLVGDQAAHAGDPPAAARARRRAPAGGGDGQQRAAIGLSDRARRSPR